MIDDETSRRAAGRQRDPEIDAAVIAATLAVAAPIYFRALFQHPPLDRTLVEETVDLVLTAITS